MKSECGALDDDGASGRKGQVDRHNQAEDPPDGEVSKI